MKKLLNKTKALLSSTKAKVIASSALAVVVIGASLGGYTLSGGFEKTNTIESKSKAEQKKQAEYAKGKADAEEKARAAIKAKADAEKKAEEEAKAQEQAKATQGGGSSNNSGGGGSSNSNVSQPPTAQEHTPAPTINVAQIEYEATQELYRLVNDYRAANGLNRLIEDRKLAECATIRADEVNYRQGHTRPNGQFYMDWVYELDLYYVGENVGGFGIDSSKNIPNGQEIAGTLFYNWRNSPGHNANMLNPEHIKMGFGIKINRVTSTVGSAQWFHSPV